MVSIARIARLSSALFLLLAGIPSFADHGGPSHGSFGLAVPATSSTGNYSVTWTINHYGVVLEEKVGSGSYAIVHSGYGMSKSFVGKPSGTYTYRIKFTFCYFSCMTTYSLPETIVVGSGSSGGTGDGISPSSSLQSADSIGATPYEVDVTSVGDSLIDVPIRVVDGVRGFQPDLAISYSSSRGVDRYNRSLAEDTIGYGWFVSGISSIRRCVVDKPNSQVIALNGSDGLCLDGMPLVQTEGTHLAAGAKYRTLVESFTQIEIKSTGGEIYFEAKSPDGTVNQYGFSADSRVNYNGGVFFHWSVNKSTDAYGNDITYQYFKPSLKGTNYPTKIEYADAAVEFKYETRSDAATVLIGSAPQTRDVYLHTIAVSYNGSAVRDYLLVDETVDGNKRLSDIQLCGYTYFGTLPECLDEIKLSWITPSSTMVGVEILVDEVVGSMGASTRFEYETIDALNPGPTFSTLPTSWGSFSLPSDTAYVSGPGAYRHVVSRQRMDNGLGATSFSDVTYAYWGDPIASAKNWGFLGFAAQSVTDLSIPSAPSVTYIQNRLDVPFLRQMSRIYQFDGDLASSPELRYAIDLDYDTTTYSGWSSGKSTHYIYNSVSLEKIYEGGVLRSATKTEQDPTFDLWKVDGVTLTKSIGTAASNGTSVPSMWGDIEVLTISGIQNVVETVAQIQNRTSSGTWLIGFITDISQTSWNGDPSDPLTASVTTDSQYTPVSTSLDVQQATSFPDTSHALYLRRTYTFDGMGRLTKLNTAGKNVGSRDEDYSDFEFDRYPKKTDYAYGLSDTVSMSDHRFGLPISFGDLNAITSSLSYDRFGRPIEVNKDGSPGVRFTYTRCDSTNCAPSYGVDPVMFIERNKLGTPSSSIVIPEKLYLDRLGRVIRREQKLVQGHWSRVDTQFDSRGRVANQSNPYVSGTTQYDTNYGYDSRDRVIFVGRPDGGSTTYTYELTSNRLVQTETETSYSSISAPTESFSIRKEYDAVGHLVKVVDAYGTPKSMDTVFRYDGQGNALSVEVDHGFGNSVLSTFTYDEHGNTKSADTPNAGLTEYEYSALNELKRSTDAAGRVITRSYDLLGRPYVRHSSGQPSTLWKWDSATNGKGKLHYVQSYTFSTTHYKETYSYDSYGRHSATSYDVLPIDSTVAESFSTATTYDQHGRPEKTTYIGDTNLEVVRRYNSSGHVYQIDQQIGSSVSRLHRVVSSNAFGLPDDERLGSSSNEISLRDTYDMSSGRLEERRTTKQGGTFTLQDSEFFWRTDGVLEKRQQNSVFGLSGVRSETFSYDQLKRLKAAITFQNGIASRTLDYDFDRLGNRKYATSDKPGDVDINAQSYGVGTAGPNALTSASVGGVTYSLNYNSVGAITSYDLPGSSVDRFIEYNVFNQPTRITVGSSLNTPSPEARDDYAYDPFGRRYSSKTSWRSGGTTYTSETLTIGSTDRLKINGPNGLVEVYKTQITPEVQHTKIVSGGNTTSTIEFVFRDHLGSPEVVSDYTGQPIDRLAFDPYGGRRAANWTGDASTSEIEGLLDSSASEHPRYRGFTGHEHLDRSGFVHMRGRVFDPALGVFVSPDPIVAFPNYSQSWNSYSYVSGEVLSYTDPTGYAQWKPRYRTDHPNVSSLSGWGRGGGVAGPRVYLYNGPSKFDQGVRNADGPATSFTADSNGSVSDNSSYYKFAFTGTSRTSADGNISVDCWMCPAYDNTTGQIVRFQPAGFGLEELMMHAVFDYVDARESGDATGRVAAGSFLIGAAVANDFSGKSRVLRASNSSLRIIKLNPKFGDLNYHARKHSNLSPEAYYKSALNNIRTGRPFKFRHDGKTKRMFVTRIGANRFRMTSTSMGGGRIYTHFDMTRRELEKVGVTLPKGF